MSGNVTDFVLTGTVPFSPEHFRVDAKSRGNPLGVWCCSHRFSFDRDHVIDRGIEESIRLAGRGIEALR